MPDAATIMNSFMPSTNIDYLVPQLYSVGSPDNFESDATGGVPWSVWKSAKAKIVVAISSASLYGQAKTMFAQLGLPLAGYIQWQ